LHRYYQYFSYKYDRSFLQLGTYIVQHLECTTSYRFLCRSNPPKSQAQPWLHSCHMILGLSSRPSSQYFHALLTASMTLQVQFIVKRGPACGSLDLAKYCFFWLS